MNWRDGYLIQAWSDYAVFREMNQGRFPLCHKLHYLQMVTEKLAKGISCHIFGKGPVKTHAGFTELLRYSKRRKNLHEGLRFGGKSRAYASYIDSLMPLADKIEKLAPVGGNFDQINPEYPWKDVNGDITCPTEYGFPEFRQRDLARIQDLVSGLFRIMGFQ